MDAEIALFYLEHDFYNESKAEMSQLYTTKERGRYDWGWVEAALRRGIEVRIRPATDEETLWAFKKLSKIKAEWTKDIMCASCKTL